MTAGRPTESVKLARTINQLGTQQAQSIRAQMNLLNNTISLAQHQRAIKLIDEMSTDFEHYLDIMYALVVNQRRAIHEGAVEVVSVAERSER